MWCIVVVDHPNVSNFNNASVALMMMMMLMLSGHEVGGEEKETQKVLLQSAFHKLHDIM